MPSHPVDNNRKEADRALGAVIGALVGDAAGGVLEFTTTDLIPEARARWAMGMPGGGVHGLRPGQVTDDGELTMALATALAAAAVVTGRNQPDDDVSALMNAVAARYARWLRSAPFDVGASCARAFGNRAVLDAAPDDAGVINLGAIMTAAARHKNADSQANGALMRVTPLAVWCAARGLSDAEVISLARAECALSHPHPACTDCSAAYCIALAHLIRHPGDASGALRAVLAAPLESDDVRDWLRFAAVDVENDELLFNDIDVRENAGHVRHGFVLAFRLLAMFASPGQKMTDYETAITRVLMRGGDTDTNAAICGGLVGALVGLRALPAEAVATVVGHTEGTQTRRPRRYSPAYAEYLVEAILSSNTEALSES